MSIPFAVAAEEPLPRTAQVELVKGAATALTLTGLALVAASVVFARTFVFTYFHGDAHPLQGLARAIFGS